MMEAAAVEAEPPIIVNAPKGTGPFEIGKIDRDRFRGAGFNHALAANRVDHLVAGFEVFQFASHGPALPDFSCGIKAVEV